MAYKLTSPNKDYTGHGFSVDFRNGVGYTDNPEVAEHVKTLGYKVETVDEAPEQVPQSIEPLVGDASSKDAAVIGADAAGPMSEAFLPPVGAGDGNDPHGEKVVAPGIHASETGPIAPGLVNEAQERKETKLAKDVRVDNEDVADATKKQAQPKASRPHAKASKDDWTQYAGFLGVPKADLEGKTRAEIIAIAEKAEGEKSTPETTPEPTEESEGEGEGDKEPEVTNGK